METKWNGATTKRKNNSLLSNRLKLKFNQINVYLQPFDFSLFLILLFIALEMAGETNVEKWKEVKKNISKKKTFSSNSIVLVCVCVLLRRHKFAQRNICGRPAAFVTRTHPEKF